MDDQPEALTSHARHKTCPFINNVETASTDVIYFITCGYLKKLYFGGKGRRFGERFWKHHRDAELKKKISLKLALQTVQFMSVFFKSKGCFLYISSNDNSCTYKQTFILIKSYFFPNSTVSTKVYLTATIQEDCSRLWEVAEKFPEMVR